MWYLVKIYVFYIVLILGTFLTHIFMREDDLSPVGAEFSYGEEGFRYGCSDGCFIRKGTVFGLAYYPFGACDASLVSGCHYSYIQS